jgi:hypothetical protein
MTRKAFISAAIVTSLLAVAVPVFAHHSFAAEYDSQKTFARITTGTPNIWSGNKTEDTKAQRHKEGRH